MFACSVEKNGQDLTLGDSGYECPYTSGTGLYEMFSVFFLNKMRKRDRSHKLEAVFSDGLEFEGFTMNLDWNTAHGSM